MKKDIIKIMSLILVHLVIVLPITMAIDIAGIQDRVDGNNVNITWKTDVESESKVEYSKNKDDLRNGDGSSREDPTLTTNHSVEILGLNYNSVYYYYVVSDNGTDVAIDNNSDQFYNFSIGDDPNAAGDDVVVESLEISGVRSDVREDYVEISWDTNMNATSIVNYGETTDLDETIENLSMVEEHYININGLTNLTTYYFEVVSSNGSDEVRDNRSGEYHFFTTLGSSDEEDGFDFDINVTDSYAIISWHTDYVSSSMINYGETQNLGLSKKDFNLVKNHAVRINDLNESTSYFFEAIVSYHDGSQIVEIKDDNGGNYHQFTTDNDEPPEIDIEFPEYVNSLSYTVEFTTDINSEIDYYINNVLTSRDRSDSNGFVSSAITLQEGTNTIQVVVTDPRNNTANETYTLIADTIAPSLTVTQPASYIQDDNLVINGSVSEEVELKFILTYSDGDSTAPGKITGLNATSIEDYGVELEWSENNESDFDEYIVYRDGERVDTQRNTDFVDVLNSSTNYVYEISAVDTNCNEGEKSDPITITTLHSQNNRSTNQSYHQPSVSLRCEDGYDSGTTVEGLFSEKVSLGEDGYYVLKVLATDVANNSRSLTFSFYLDTEDPEFEDINPEDGTEIFEQFADEVDISGKTDPGAKVYLYIKRTPLGTVGWNESISVSGFPTTIQHISEADLNASSSSDSRADYDTVADANGSFSFTNVDITQSVVLGYRFTEVSYSDLQDWNELYYREHGMPAQLLFLATDSFGRRGAESVTYDVQTCWSGDSRWDAVPLLTYQSPAYLSTERMAEGTETLYFYFNFTYYGDEDEDDPEIIGVDIQRACDDTILGDTRYNHSCEIMKASPTSVEPIGNAAYVIYRLSRYENMDNWTVDSWSSFFDSLTDNEMVFPMKITLRYRYKNESGK